MKQLNVGDRIKNINCTCHAGQIDHNANKFKFGVVSGYDPYTLDGRAYFINYDDGATGHGWRCCYELQEKKTIMQKVSVMMKKLLSGDTQTLVKAGYINGDLDLTEKGKQALLAHLFDANKEALVKSAEEDLAEEKNEE